MNVLGKLRVLFLQIEVEILDLALRVIRSQQARAERARIVEHGSPIHGQQSLVANFEHVARLRILDCNGSDNRVRTASGVALAHLRQFFYRDSGLQLVQKVRPRVGVTDGVARIDGEDGWQCGVEHAQVDRFFVRFDGVDLAFIGT